ncbi:MAG: Ig-like domain-containing protein [Luteolibacter sp.]
MKRWTYFVRITAVVAALFASHAIADAGTILYYDSVSGRTSNALDRLDSQTDADFVTSSSATTSLGSNAVFSAEHASQTVVQGLGDGLDKQFRFGSSSGGAGTMAGPLSVAHMANGPYIEMSFTAAQDLILNELSFNLYNNSANASIYGARDAALFVKVSSDNFSQFGESFTSPTNNGNQGTVNFSDTREVAKGDLVVLRIAFTDRTRSQNDNQAATRIGAINISASAGTISRKLRVISYNIHGGKGPDDEGTPQANLTAFRNNFMQNEDVICLQEVDNGDCWTAVQSVFSDYPYRYRTINKETDYNWWETRKETSIAIVSKYPFASTEYELIQIDPTYDKWQRHAQHVTINIGGEAVNIFHYHNTYNFNTNDWEYEKSGMVKFRDYVYSQLGISSLANGGRLVMLGDFNLLQANVATILPTPAHKWNGRDHISSVPEFTTSGSYATVNADLSDHPALWASLDLAGPTPSPLTWESAPAETGATSITMTATTANDTNGVEYYFANTTIANGSHDSGWQDSPVFTDTGLNAETSYSYTVKARDKSVNQNESLPSAVTAAARAPKSVEESYEATAGESLNIAANGVLANDTDLNDDTLTAVLVSGVSHGSLSLNADGSFSYTPALDYSGEDSFTYKANDGVFDSNIATVTLAVTAAPSSYSTWESSIIWESGDDNSPTGDPDTDGINNGMEFVLGGNPVVPDTSIQPTTTIGASNLTFSYSRSADSKATTTQAVQWSTDLSAWNAIDVSPSDPNQVVIDIPRSIAPSGILFTRLHVVLP